MDYIYSIVLGAVQAITEFLPISSSGHLIIFHQFLKSPLLDSAAFDVMLHAGTLLAALIYFWPEIKKIFIGFFQTIGRFKISTDFNQQLPWLLIVGSVPAALVGYFFNDFIEQAFRSIHWIIIPLIAGGLLFILAEKFGLKKRNLDSMNFLDTLLIGLAQVLAFIPGTSRSGITITAALGSGFKRADAAKFSFLLSLPVIAGATIQKITQVASGDFSAHSLFVFILGAVTSAGVGYVVIKYFIHFLERHSLTVFAVYRFILAAILIAIFLV
ncbi:MAG: undecaprenyl-diphosphate phosphatase [Candidatus Komeilibacteria bacterium]|nr:undecaprenyl-diphosphate phosphatase [Candidatus Komeilibacteria bacterium]